MRALVTGGGGFLGEALVRSLVARGDQVTFLARGRYPGLEALGATAIAADLRDRAAVFAACDGMDVVFHVAAKAGGWGKAAEFESINVQGTANVIDACRGRGVRSLVYTSTPSVVHDGEPIEGGDESLPYARRFLAHYPRTKAEAEKRVRGANGPELRTVSLRPHFIWGPGDRHLLPRLLDRARAGRLRRIGAGDPL
ncbi:MAG TPA: NAD-dependent epimerase/dehydratase family protein, partial [Vulgatibacter sp.]